MKYLVVAISFLALLSPARVRAAIGCTLSNPAEDLKYLYPEMTTYREELNELPRMKGGAELFKGLKERLGSDLDPIYETFETPYTVYTVFKGQAKIGVVHGVNVPGKGGVIQVFLALDPGTAAIKNFFFQRLESPTAALLRNKDFRSQFAGLTLGDFYKHDYYALVGTRAADKVAAIKPPPMPAGGQPDYVASLRGVRKNLILLDLFVYNRRFEPFFKRAQEASQKIKEKKD